MEHRRLLAATRSQGERLAAAADGHLRLTAGPGCPDWNVADLVFHVGSVHHFWRHIASGAILGPATWVEPERPDDDALVAWYRDELAELLTVLERTDPATEVWTWAPQHEVAFIVRRMAQETAVHGWDASNAAGSPEPVATDVAIDGIDEFLDVILPAFPAALVEPGESVHLHATDDPGEWVARVAGGTLEVKRAHAKADAAVRATASDLLLLLWRRLTPDDVDVHGDADALERFLARLPTGGDG